jgi:hypothetical protein
LVIPFDSLDPDRQAPCRSARGAPGVTRSKRVSPSSPSLREEGERGGKKAQGSNEPPRRTPLERAARPAEAVPDDLQAGGDGFPMMRSAKAATPESGV